jgi:hypothetical protein
VGRVSANAREPTATTAAAPNPAHISQRCRCFSGVVAGSGNS